MKKLRKLLAAVSAATICAVSTTPFVSNAIALFFDTEVTPYTVSFTAKRTKFFLNQEMSDYYKYDEEDLERRSYVEKDGRVATCYNEGMNIYTNDNNYLIGCHYQFYRYEDGSTFLRAETCPLAFLPYYLTDKTEQETFINYLEDNDIPYEAKEYPSEIIVDIYPNQKFQRDVFFKALIDIKENTGIICEWVLLESAVQITDVENALPEKTLDGDANEDGEVDIADATAIIQHIGNPGKYGLTMQGMANADCYNTGDGVTGMDAIAIQKLEAGLIESFEEA